MVDKLGKLEGLELLMVGWYREFVGHFSWSLVQDEFEGVLALDLLLDL